MTNDVEALDQLVTDGVTTLVQNTLILVGSAVILFFLDWRLALAVIVGDPVHDRRDGVLPVTLVARVPRRCASGSASSPRRSPRTSPACASSRRSRARTRTRRRFREVNAHYRDANHQTVVLSGLYFPFVDFLSAIATAIVLGYGGYLVFDDAITIGTLLRVHPLPVQLLRPGAAAVAALQHVPLRDGGARQDHGRASTRSPRCSTGPARASSRTSTATCASRTSASPTAAAPRCCTASTSTCRPERRSRSSATRARASRRSRSCSRASTTRVEGRITIDGVDLRDVTQASLRRQLGVVPQEGFLFAGTVRDNIAFGRPGREPRGGRRRRDRRSARTSSSSGSRTATTRSCRSAARGSRSASASSSRSRARCSPTRAS